MEGVRLWCVLSQALSIGSMDFERFELSRGFTRG